MVRATHRGGREGRPAPAEHKGDTWQLKDAEARFSGLFTRALERPQRVTRHGRRAVVVLAEEEYRKLQGQGAEKHNLAEFLAGLSPLGELDLRRDHYDIQPRIGA
jgi:prevent-host-death family protein